MGKAGLLIKLGDMKGRHAMSEKTNVIEVDFELIPEHVREELAMATLDAVRNVISNTL